MAEEDSNDPGDSAGFRRVDLAPTFGVDQDREALAILENVVQDRPVVGIPSQKLIVGLGAVHCLTQQEPSGEMVSSD